MSHGTQFTALTCIWRSRLARASAWNIPKNKKKGAPARDGRRSQKKDPGCCQNGLPKSIATKKTSDSATSAVKSVLECYGCIHFQIFLFSCPSQDSQPQLSYQPPKPDQSDQGKMSSWNSLHFNILTRQIFWSTFTLGKSNLVTWPASL